MAVNQTPNVYYGLPLTSKRLGQMYGVVPQTMLTWLCRSEFTKFEVHQHPRSFLWCKEFETKLDEFADKKGYRRCIESKVPSRYLSVGKSLS